MNLSKEINCDHWLLKKVHHPSTIFTENKPFMEMFMFRNANETSHELSAYGDHMSEMTKLRDEVILIFVFNLHLHQIAL